jgi:hypothetical protein
LSRAILYPVFALVAWTFIVLLRMAALRLRSGVRPAEFSLGESERVPTAAKLANRNYMNLLEMPTLFYVVVALVYATNVASPTIVALAWSYVGARMAHSLVHLSYNNVMHRLAVFALSNVLLAVLWVVAGMALTTKA